MTRDKSKFLNLESRKDGGFVAFGDNKKASSKDLVKLVNQTLFRLKMFSM